jgi:hypothetical protein
MKKEKQINVQIRQAADYLGEALCCNGCIVHRYDAISTSSVYLKIDAGVACSIRLSDHEGRGDLAYRFNYLANETGTDVYCLNGSTDRYYYQSGALGTMVNDVLVLRDERELMYKNYDELVQERLTSGEHQKGFWQKAYLVSSEQAVAA